MKKFYLLSLLFCILSCLCYAQENRENMYIPGEIVLKGSLQNVLAFLEKESISVVSSTMIEKGIYHIVLKDYPKDIRILVQRISGSVQGIDFIEPNWILDLKDIKTPKDPYFLSQWAMENLGQDSPTGAQGKPGADIKILKAWEMSKGKREIVVGVIDTGIDYNHPDLKDNMWVNEAELKGVDGKDDDGNGYTDDKYGWNFITAGREKPYYGQLGHPDPMDDNGHGTHCAGIIGAKPDNYRGVAGINWNVRLMALKFLSKSGSGNTVDAYRAILYAIRNKADILSNSWGGGGKSELLLHAIQEAHKNGILFVAAAGNAGSNCDHRDFFPANHEVENVISVAATDNKDQLATFSNYGSSKVHIAAPGVSIMSSIPLSRAETPKFAYDAYSGTSMAAPFVSGAAALLLSFDESLKHKPSEIKKRLIETVDIMPHLAGMVQSQGRLNVARALQNDVNPIRKEGKVYTREYEIIAPRFNEELVDKTWDIHQPDAKYMRLYFSWILADIPDIDVLAVYDKYYRLVFKFDNQYPQGFWTPWMQTDTLRIRFANALVAVETVEEKEFPSPQEGFNAGAKICFIDSSTQKTICLLPKQSKPFANFESEGFRLEKIEYRKDETQNAEKKNE